MTGAIISANGTSSVRVEGVLTVATVAKAKDAMLSALRAVDRFCLDAEGVTACDLAGVQFLVAARASARARGQGADSGRVSSVVRAAVECAGIPLNSLGIQVGARAKTSSSKLDMGLSGIKLEAAGPRSPGRDAARVGLSGFRLEPAGPTGAGRNRKAAAPTYRIRIAPRPSLFVSGVSAGEMLDKLRGMGECMVIAHIDNVLELEHSDPEICAFAWDIILSTEQGAGAIRDVFRGSEGVITPDIEDLSADLGMDIDAPQPRLGDILVKRGDLAIEHLNESLAVQSKLGQVLVDSGRVSESKVMSALAEQEFLAKLHQQATKGSVRISASELAALVATANELVASLERVGQATDNGASVAPLAVRLRDMVQSLCVAPFGKLASRLKVNARDIAAKAGKDVGLVVEGGDIEIEGNILDHLGNALACLIRQSIDHSIESLEERTRLDKPGSGTIRLVVADLGQHASVSFIDDGKGLDGADIMGEVTREIDALHGVVMMRGIEGMGSSIEMLLPLLHRR